MKFNKRFLVKYSLLAVVFIMNGFALRAHAQLQFIEPVRFEEQNIDDFGLAGTHKIALTFDDGPGEGSAELLNILKQYNIKATFFMIGENVVDPQFKSVMKRIVPEGHILANHTYTHPELNTATYKKNPKKLISEILKTHIALQKYQATGANLYFRAPYGDWQDSNAAALNANPILVNYIGPIYWDIGGEITEQNGVMVDAADWDCWDHKIAVDKCMQGYRYAIEHLDGGVVLSHTIYQQSTDMWKVLIPILKSEGFEFITLDQVNNLQKYREQKQNQNGGPAHPI